MCPSKWPKSHHMLRARSTTKVHVLIAIHIKWASGIGSWATGRDTGMVSSLVDHVNAWSLTEKHGLLRLSIYDYQQQLIQKCCVCNLESTRQMDSADVQGLHCCRLRVRAVETSLMRAFLTSPNPRPNVTSACMTALKTRNITRSFNQLTDIIQLIPTTQPCVRLYWLGLTQTY